MINYNLIIKSLLLLCWLPFFSLAQTRQTALPASDPGIPAIGYAYKGQLKTKNTHEVESSNWILGCETLDRDMTDYHQYKYYLDPLGIRMLRFQAGWAKTEKEIGVYDWEWLDRIINDAIERNCIPWLETSYGNPIYPDGGGTNLSAGIPASEEALAAWDRWVKAMVVRYKDKVKDWEVWNEPNFGDNIINTPEDVAALNIRTAEIIKSIQPEAKISGLSMGHIDLDYADSFFRYIHKHGKMHLFDNMTYHDYVYNPDANYCSVADLRRVLDKYAPEVKLRQGENGAPSEPGFGRGALGDYQWTELSQAKWNTRRMLGNLGHDIECSILGIIDMNYNASGPITRLNVKGIIQSDSTRRAIRPKMAYYAMQNVTALFDHSLQRINKLHKTFNAGASIEAGEIKYHLNTDRSLAVYGYKEKSTGNDLFTIWMDENIPQNINQMKNIRLILIGAQIDQPCYVDIISGAVFEVPADKWRKEGKQIIVEDLPVYDAPIVLTDKRIVSLEME